MSRARALGTVEAVEPGRCVVPTELPGCARPVEDSSSTGQLTGSYSRRLLCGSWQLFCCAIMAWLVLMSIVASVVFVAGRSSKERLSQLSHDAPLASRLEDTLYDTEEDGENIPEKERLSEANASSPASSERQTMMSVALWLRDLNVTRESEDDILLDNDPKNTTQTADSTRLDVGAGLAGPNLTNSADNLSFDKSDKMAENQNHTNTTDSPALNVSDKGSQLASDMQTYSVASAGDKIPQISLQLGLPRNQLRRMARKRANGKRARGNRKRRRKNLENKNSGKARTLLLKRYQDKRRRHRCRKLRRQRAKTRSGETPRNSSRRRQSSSKLRQLWTQSQKYQAWRRQQSQQQLLTQPAAQLAIEQLWQGLFRQGDHWKQVYEEMHNTTRSLEPGLEISKENWEELATSLPDHNVHYIKKS